MFKTEFWEDDSGPIRAILFRDFRIPTLSGVKALGMEPLRVRPFKNVLRSDISVTFKDDFFFSNFSTYFFIFQIFDIFLYRKKIYKKSQYFFEKKIQNNFPIFFSEKKPK